MTSMTRRHGNNKAKHYKIEVASKNSCWGLSFEVSLNILNSLVKGLRKNNIYEITSIKTYMKSPCSRSIQVELGKVEGF